MITEDKAAGVLLGLAAGDALGRPVEFRSADQIAAEQGTVTEMVGYGTWGKPAGTTTDDTDLAICIARSLVENGTFEPSDIASRFVDWYDSGPFDIGSMTAQAIGRLKEGESWDEAGQNVWETSPEGRNAGNGSVMRCPPLAIAYPTDTDELVRFSRESSQITHADPRCTEGCAVLNLTIAGYLEGVNRPLQNALEQLRHDLPDELHSALEHIANGDEPDSLSTSGYVVHTLQTALNDALTAVSVEDAIVTAVNRGGDTDTIGAVAGAVAGARFGASDLPDRWLDDIGGEKEVRRLAIDLLNLSQQ